MEILQPLKADASGCGCSPTRNLPGPCPEGGQMARVEVTTALGLHSSQVCVEGGGSGNSLALRHCPYLFHQNSVFQGHWRAHGHCSSERLNWSSLLFLPVQTPACQTCRGTRIYNMMIQTTGLALFSPLLVSVYIWLEVRNMCDVGCCLIIFFPSSLSQYVFTLFIIHVQSKTP